MIKIVEFSIYVLIMITIVLGLALASSGHVLEGFYIVLIMVVCAIIVPFLTRDY
jgi:hypothetical protein